MSICRTCKYWQGNGGIDCSDDEDEHGNPIESCAYFEIYTPDV